MFRPDDILYEDNHLIVVNKRCGDLVQPDRETDDALENEIKAMIKVRDHKPGDVFLGVVHRIDRPVSGAVVFAKTSKALTRLNEMIRNGEIHKRYWARHATRLLKSNCLQAATTRFAPSSQKSAVRLRVI